MADDGMFLNFNIEETASPVSQRFKGGSWRDRLKAQKSAKYRAEKRAGDSSANRHSSSKDNDVSREFPDLRPSKRRRENGYGSGAGVENRKELDAATQRNNHGKNNTRPREIISSLFSYNPTPSNVVEEKALHDAETAPTKPSNAPLVDGIDTFTSLGLSATIAAHLLTKMALKTPTAIQKASISQMLKEESDAFIQSETGSGKTLAYLLPLVQRIMTMAERSQRDRSDSSLHRDSGLFAIILAPTRELCKQISVVLERLLGCAHYIVAGTVIGGEKKKSEKARLRKGLNILVATPGRLVDHLENTKVLDISSVRWLVLDEGDRLMDLGFEQDITKIVTALDQRKSHHAGLGLPAKRTTVLCSATLKTNVQKLGEISLKDAVLVKGESSDLEQDQDNSTTINSAFLAPAQLKQSYLVTATKLRLVTLTALLKRTFARKGSVMKAIVFVSCADSVEFHYKAFTRSELSNRDDEQGGKPVAPSSNVVGGEVRPSEHEAIASAGMLSTSDNPVTLYKLHGSLPQATRTAIVKAFATASTPSLLIATDVASRGLDLPNLDLVIEYDPAFSSDDHLHRIGRTARLGRDGRAIIFLLPGKEEGYVEILKNSYKKSDEASNVRNVTQSDANDVLRKGFSPSSGIASAQQSWESQATDFQLEVERWVLASPQTKELARKAFQSHVRAYATHVANERHWFDIKDLHLGHLAKAFGLRDAPGRMNVQGMGGRGSKESSNPRHKKRNTSDGMEGLDNKATGIDATVQEDEAARKMREKVRNRKMMMGAGADEFNIA